MLDPVIEYTHQEVGIAVVGGYVYRGQGIPGLDGHFVFADWTTGYAPPGNGTLLVATRVPPGQGLWQIQRLTIANSPSGRVDHFIQSLGQDASGEIYLLTSSRSGPSGSTGEVFKVVPAQ